MADPKDQTPLPSTIRLQVQIRKEDTIPGMREILEEKREEKLQEKFKSCTVKEDARIVMEQTEPAVNGCDENLAEEEKKKANLAKSTTSNKGAKLKA